MNAGVKPSLRVAHVWAQRHCKLQAGDSLGQALMPETCAADHNTQSGVAPRQAEACLKQPQRYDCRL